MEGWRLEQEILYSPEYAVAKIKLLPRESVIAEPGAMIAMTPNLEVKAEFARGGVLKSMARSFFGKESFFTTTFTALGEAELVLGRGQPGDMWCVSLNNETIYAQSGAFVACTPGVHVNAGWGGARGFFAGNMLFLLEITGTGLVWLATFGALRETTLGLGEDYVIDTGHVAGFHGNTMYTVTSAGGFKSFLTSGEGFVCRFRGPGKVWTQSRNAVAYAWWIDKYRPVKRSSRDHD